MNKLFRILIFTALALFSRSAFAQVTLIPSTFTAEDQITIRVDLTGTVAQGLAQPYIWIWSELQNGSGQDGIVNTDWGNSPETARWTNVSGNVWEFTFTPTTMFNRAPGELKRFGFLIKAKNGSVQTPDYKWYNFDPLVFIESEFRIFPAKVSATDVVTVYIRTSLSNSIPVQRMSPQTLSVQVFDATNNQVGTTQTLPVRSEGNNLYSVTFVPSRLPSVPVGSTIKSMKYKFIGNGYDAQGATITVESSENEYVFFDLR
ncbi:MAG TPA: hypothetical protein VGD33_10945 [Chitinophagaceae bacterium]